MDMCKLERFYPEQERDFERALSEIRRGKKTTHWMWYIFPQLRGLGRSQTAYYYGIADREEAKRYWADDMLRENLTKITEAFLALPSQPPSHVMGGIDAKKLFSCMTLFDEVAGGETAIFRQVLDKFYDGNRDPDTLEILSREEK